MYCHLLSFHYFCEPHKIFQHARKLVGAELQQITRYQKYLPDVLGKRALGNLDAKDTEYDQNVVPSILNEFGTVAFW